MTASTASDRRLHPLSWLFATAKAARGFILPWVLVLFASGGSNYELWATLFVVPAAIGAAVEYLVFRYRLTDDDIVIRDGVFTRRERHIPYGRIENIDTVQNPFHRLFNVALVRVETSSGGKPEAVIRVLATDAVDEMRDRVFADRGAGFADVESGTDDPASAEEGARDLPGASQVRDALAAARGARSEGAGRATGRLLLELPTTEIVRLGLISNKGMVVLGGALGLLWQQGSAWETRWWEGIESRVDAVRDFLTGTLSAPPLLVGALSVLAVLIVAVALLRLLSVGWFILQLHGFSLRRSGGDIHAEYGLFSRTSRTIPTRRIQALNTVESPLHRWFRRQSVELQTVGGAGDDGYDLEDGNFGKETQWLAPMVPADAVPGLVRDVLSEIDLEVLEWRPLARGAAARIFKRWAFATVVVTLPVAYFGVAWGSAVLLPGLLWSFLHARLYVRHSGYALADWGVAWRSGWWNRSLKLVRYGKVQTVARQQSPFDRRRDMASVLVDTAGGEMFGHTVEIPYLPEADAAVVASRLYAEAGRRAYRL